MEKVNINGIELEVELKARTGKSFRVGDHVKVLKKESYGTSYKSFLGVVVGFDPFQKNPAINVCYLENSYSETKVVFVSYTEKTDDIEICAADPHEYVFGKAEVVKQLESEILKKTEELAALERKKSFFMHYFNRYFEEAVAKVGV